MLTGSSTGLHRLGAYEDPITYASALNSEGEEIPGEPLLL
jgi:hypothetical protein